MERPLGIKEFLLFDTIIIIIIIISSSSSSSIIKNEKIRVTLCEKAAGALYIVTTFLASPYSASCLFYAYRVREFYREASLVLLYRI